MSKPQTVPFRDVIAVASKAPFIVEGTNRAASVDSGEFTLVSANNTVKLHVAQLNAKSTGRAETKANAMLLAHCRNNFVYVTSLLERISKKAKLMNEAQHAGLTVAPEDWADLHQMQLEADATLEIAANVNAPI